MDRTLHNKFMRKAILKAREGLRQGQTPFGACIVKENQVVSCEHNGVWRGRDITAHAEVRAIRQACKKLRTIDLSGCIIYSTCEPCPMCFSACHWARISKIFFGARIRDAQKIGFNELPISNQQMKTLGGSRMTIIPGILRAENLKLFRDWQNGRNGRSY